MYSAVLYDEVLIALLNKVTELVSKVLADDLAEVSVFSNECIELCCKLGLNYGHHIGKRKCNSDFLCGPIHKVDMIDMSLSFHGIVEFVHAVKKAVVDQSQIYLVSKHNVKCSYSRLVHLYKWIPGTLTNKVVKKAYEIRHGVKLSGIPKLIISANTSVYEVISNEVNIFCDRTYNFIRVITFIDSNVRATKLFNNITCIMLNDESAYYPLFISHLINTTFNFVTSQ